MKPVCPFAQRQRESDKPAYLEDFVDENGIRTTIEYTVNDDGKKVKVGRRIPHRSGQFQ
jgi:translation initiation factor 3 subunit G